MSGICSTTHLSSVGTTLLFLFDEVHSRTNLQLDKAPTACDPEFGWSWRFWRWGRQFFFGFDMNGDDREIQVWGGVNQRPDRSSVQATNAWEARLMGSVLKAIHSKTICAGSMRSGGRADGHTAARLRRNGERHEDQERGDQEFHRTPTIRL